MGEWTETTIGQVLTLQRGFDITRAQQRPGLVPVVSSGGIGSYHDEVAVRGPGVVIGRKGTLGKVFYLSDDYWPHDTTLWVKDFKGNHPCFVYYYFLQLDVMGFDVGSANPTLNRNHVHAIPVSWPDLASQVKIGGLLGALDDKITVNERIVAIGRELAVTSFAAAVEELTVGHALSVVTGLISRGVAPRYVDDPGGLLILNQKCIRAGRVNIGPARRTVSDKVPALKVLRYGDVLVNSTGVGTLGRVARWTGNEPCTVDSHVTIVRFDPEAIDPVCAAFAMLAAQSEIERLGEGSTGQTELARAKLGSLDLAMPSQQASAALRPVLEGLEKRAEAALAESASLVQLRDTLLPKLMSGQLRIKDAQEIVEDVT